MFNNPQRKAKAQNKSAKHNINNNKATEIVLGIRQSNIIDAYFFTIKFYTLAIKSSLGLRLLPKLVRPQHNGDPFAYSTPVPGSPYPPMCPIHFPRTQFCCFLDVRTSPHNTHTHAFTQFQYQYQYQSFV